MDEKRMGEIALAILKDRFQRTPVSLDDIKRDLGNVSKRTGIPLDELKVFTKSVLTKVLEDILS